MTIRSYQYQVQALISPSTSTTYTRTASDTAIVSDSVEASINAQFLDVNQPIDPFDQFVYFLLTPGGVSFVEDTLDLSQEVSVFGYEYPESDLSLSQSVSYTGPINKDPFHSGVVSDSVEFGYLVRTFDIEDGLGLDQTASVTYTFSVTDSNVVTDEAFRSSVVDHEISFTETVSWGYGYDAESELDLSQAVADDLILNQVIVDNEVVNQAMTYFLESRCNRYNFNSFHGEGGTAPADKPLTYKNQFLVQSLDDGTIVQLRNPEMDDRRRYAYDRVNRRFYDNTLDLYADDSWVTQQRQLYTIVATKRDDLDTLWTFLQDNLGREVLVKDWKGQTWIVVILNPGEIYSEDQDGYWTIDFEVEGERWPGEYVVDFLELDETLSRAGSIWTRSAEGDIEFTRGEVANREYDLSIDDDMTGVLTDTVTESVV